MKPIQKAIMIAATLLTTQSGLASVNEESVSRLKSQIISLAKSYEGLGDPDQSKQKNIEALVEKLVQENPMPPVNDRIPLLPGTWKQVWGPYDYRNDNGSVDPKLGVKEIYQVISADGYY